MWPTFAQFYNLLESISFNPKVWPRVADLLGNQWFCCLDGFLNTTEVADLRQAFKLQQEADALKKAGVGQDHQFTVDRSVRGDYIKWIEPKEALPAAQLFLQRVQGVLEALNPLLFLSLKDFECHYALYPPGSFYEKHIDQFQGSSHRLLSFACYLNPQWKEAHGGCLRLYSASGESHEIAPLAGRLVIFRSDLVPHEVLTTAVNRYSITGWLRDQPINLPY